MNLKKNDKIIAVVGVVILVVAAVSIFYLSSDGEIGTPSDEEGKPIFKVTYEKRSTSVQPDNPDFIVQDKIGNRRDTVYVGSAQVSGENVESVDFFVDFTDNKILLNKLGKDVITITIKDSEGKELETKTITGEGNATFTLKIGPKISTEQIEAETEEEARQILKESYSSTSKTYTIEVSLQKKLELFSKAESFNLKILKNYYEYDVEEIEEPNDGGDPPVESDGGSDLSMFYHNLHNTGRPII